MHPGDEQKSARRAAEPPGAHGGVHGGVEEDTGAVREHFQQQRVVRAGVPGSEFPCQERGQDLADRVWVGFQV
ncbi:unnamed protein product [Linum tenue]|uniref:Uncharacterized protein n=1 Tax=Linum tenue TaxID=586396 RepID=A0AAV0R6X9_9ROSI|nr:unnamed protein product [Linum tenue]